jgi:hypothetical protein
MMAKLMENKMAAEQDDSNEFYSVSLSFFFAMRCIGMRKCEKTRQENRQSSRAKRGQLY